MNKNKTNLQRLQEYYNSMEERYGITNNIECITEITFQGFSIIKCIEYGPNSYYNEYFDIIAKDNKFYNSNFDDIKKLNEDLFK